MTPSTIGSPLNEARPPTILVVEDEYMLRLAIVESLQDCGWRVLEADSFEQAIAVSSSGTPVEVLFTDVRINGQGCGWDVAEVFRRARPDIGVMYTSGNSSNGSRAVPDSLFFKKPYQASSIVEA
jgi:CheY-like chemotaxis protein